jgi:hypothetical protein
MSLIFLDIWLLECQERAIEVVIMVMATVVMIMMTMTHIIVIIIIMFILLSPLCKLIKNYIPATNQVSRVHSVADFVYLKFVLHAILFRQ